MESKGRLFVLCNDKFKDNPVYACVQGGHAVAQYFIDNADYGYDINKGWTNETIVYLWYPEKEFLSWQESNWPLHNAGLKGLNVYEWKEPDQGNLMTSAAIWEDDIVNHDWNQPIMKNINKLQLVK